MLGWYNPKCIHRPRYQQWIWNHHGGGISRHLQVQKPSPYIAHLQHIFANPDEICFYHFRWATLKEEERMGKTIIREPVASEWIVEKMRQGVANYEKMTCDMVGS